MYRFISGLIVVLFLAACGTNGSTAPVATPVATNAPLATDGPTATDASAGTSAPAATEIASATAAPATTIIPATVLQEVVIAMPYIPNVQFSQFYVADQRGYYAAEGLKVRFDYNFETDVVQRVAQGTLQFGQASGDSVLLARAQGLPVRTVATSSQRFPTVFFSKAEQNIATPADLKGKTVGIPGRFGASYIGLRALLYANKMTEQDLDIQEIGFTQVAALSEDKVQVASGYGNNEPVQLAERGIKLNVIAVADSYSLASDGIITSEKLINENPQLVRSFVRATMRGMQDTISDPQAAFEIALSQIPEAQQGDLTLQRKVLDATLPYWQSDLTKQYGLGYTDLEAWKSTHTFLRDAGILQKDLNVEEAFSNEFLK